MKIIDNTIERHGNRRVFFTLIILLVAILIINILIADRIQKRFVVEDETFIYQYFKKTKWVFVDSQQRELAAYSPYHNKSYSGLSERIIDYNNHTIKKAYNWDDFTYEIYLDETLIHSSNIIEVEYRVNGFGIDKNNEDDESLFEIKLIEKVNKTIQYVSRGISYIVVISLFLIILGVSNLIYTEFFWKMNHFLSVRNGEPTDLYIFMSRFVDIIFMLTGILFPYITIFLD